MKRKQATNIWLIGAVLVILGCSPSQTDSSLRDGGVVTRDSRMPVDYALASEDRGLDAQVATADAGFAWSPSGPADLVLNQRLLASDIWFDEIDVDPLSCSYLERCVDGVGRRRLLRFGVATGNVGNQDLVLGDVRMLDDEVEFSECHQHYHYSDYADYKLTAEDEIVRQGHKQAFCLMDTRPMAGVNGDTIRERAFYNCRFQGISAGWEDVYGSELDCQWIDITDLSAGDYQLVVTINPSGLLKESRLDNNRASVDVVVPPLSLTEACSVDARRGLKSSCGWRLEQNFRCSPGSTIRASGGGCYGLGHCEGKIALRACDGHGEACSSGTSLDEDVEGCDGSCPALAFQCPASGRVGLWSNAVTADASVEIVLNDEPILLNERCSGEVPNGLSRLCGWQEKPQLLTCIPGSRYVSSCSKSTSDCSVEPVCDGDPLMRVCDGDKDCSPFQFIAEGDDACGTRCPRVEFACPASGKVQIWTAAFDIHEAFFCEINVDLYSDR